MKFIIEKAALIAALAAVQGAVQRRVTVPILATIKIEAGKKGVAFTGTDLDLQACAIAEAEVKKAGAIAAPADTLVGFARKLPDLPVTIEVAERGLVVSAGRARMTIPTLPAEDFPQFNALAPVAKWSMPAGDLRRLIDQTRAAISTEATRYYLNGIFLHMRGERLAAVATDGHRLALSETTAPVFDGDMPKLIVPRAAVAEIRKMIADAEDDVHIEAGPAAIKVEHGPAALVTKVIDGQFPDYERIIPRDPPNVTTCKREDLKEAIARVMIVAGDDARSVRLEPGEDALSVASRHADHGEASDAVAASHDGAAVIIGFNGKYLMDALAQSDGEDIVIAMSDSAAPAVMRDPTAANALCVLMPLRV